MNCCSVPVLPWNRSEARPTAALLRDIRQSEAHAHLQHLLEDLGQFSIKVVNSNSAMTAAIPESKIMSSEGVGSKKAVGKQKNLESRKVSFICRYSYFFNFSVY